MVNAVVDFDFLHFSESEVAEGVILRADFVHVLVLIDYLSGYV